MESNEAFKKLIQNQKEVIKKLSEIKLGEDKLKVYKIAKGYLEITDENNAGILSIWLKQKKDKFKDYILTKIFIDTNLPIYYHDNIYNGETNLSIEVLNSLDLAYASSVKEWVYTYMKPFLEKILDENELQRGKVGEKKFLAFFNQVYESNLITAFIRNFSILIDEILTKKINDSKTRFLSFGFIRRMTDCIYDEDYTGLSTNIYFKKKISDVFYNSRRLIRNLFAFEFIKSLELFNITNIPFGEIVKSDEEIEYKYNDNNIIIRFKPKEVGINSGFILHIIKNEQFNGEEKSLNCFYVKKCHGSTKAGSNNFKKEDSETFLRSSSISFNASLSSIIKKSKLEKRKFDLKEPFLYSLLNSLNFTPEVKFFINPYTIDGFYIATKSISDMKNRFISLSKISVGTNKDNDNFLKESLNQTDFISRFLRLRDLHNDNFGFVTEHNKEIYKLFAIIDFAQPIFMESYRIPSEKLKTEFLDCTYSEQKNEGIRILNLDDAYLDDNGIFMKKFLKVEEKIRFLNGFNAFEQFKNRIETVKLPQIDFSKIKREYFDDEEPDDLLDEKLRNILYIQSENIKNLMNQKRGTENNQEENMLKHPITKQPRTNAELIGFKLGKKPKDIDDPSEGQLDYLDDAFEDLDNYCKSIMYNYKILKKIITDGYNKYFAN